jgi:hypothetical protein
MGLAGKSTNDRRSRCLARDRPLFSVVFVGSRHQPFSASLANPVNLVSLGHTRRIRLPHPSAISPAQRAVELESFKALQSRERART